MPKIRPFEQILLECVEDKCERGVHFYARVHPEYLSPAEIQAGMGDEVLFSYFYSDEDQTTTIIDYHDCEEIYAYADAFVTRESRREKVGGRDLAKKLLGL